MQNPWGNLGLVLCLVAATAGCPGAKSGPALQQRWSFEDGLEGWQVSGAAFSHQPIDHWPNAAEARPVTLPQLETIGGNYWDVAYPIGISGRHWIGTARPDATGRSGGDEPTGELTSPVITLQRGKVGALIGAPSEPDPG